MATKKMTRVQRITARDRGRCGVHLLGCGKSVSNMTDDHILPKSLLKACQLDFPESHSLLSAVDLNRQPMCHSCNAAKRERVVSQPLLNGGWPVFQCQCHALQCRSDDVIVLLTRLFPGVQARKYRPAPGCVILDQDDRLWLAVPVFGFGPVYRGAQRITIDYRDGVRESWLSVRTELKDRFVAPLSGDRGHYFVNFGETAPGWGAMNRLWAERVGITSMVAMDGYHEATSFYGWSHDRNNRCIMSGCGSRQRSWSHGLCEWHIDEARKYSWQSMRLGNAVR